MSVILALDTSSPVLSLALATTNGANQKIPGTIRTKTAEGLRTHSEQILPLIDELLKAEGLSPAQIDTFLIGRGPGSFTGLRVGFAVVKGFLACEKKDCYGALSLDTIAANTDLLEGALLGICLDAFRSKIYFQVYRRQNKMWAAQGEVAALTLAELAPKLESGMTLAGDALKRYAPDFARFAQEKNLRLLPEAEGYPRASVMIDLFLNHQQLFTRLQSPADLVPLYFRLSEAEEKHTDHARSH